MFVRLYTYMYECIRGVTSSVADLEGAKGTRASLSVQFIFIFIQFSENIILNIRLVVSPWG